MFKFVIFKLLKCFFEDCSEKFVSINDRLSHIEKFHVDEIRCQYCNKYFENAGSNKPLIKNIELNHMCHACKEIGNIEFQCSHLCIIRKPKPVPLSIKYKFTIWKELEYYSKLPAFRNKVMWPL